MSAFETDHLSINPEVNKFYIYDINNQAHIYKYHNDGYYSLGRVHPIIMGDDVDASVNIGEDGIPEKTVKIDQPVQPYGDIVNQHFDNKDQALLYLCKKGYNITGANANDSGIYNKIITGGTHKRRGKGTKKGKSKKGGKRVKGVKSKKGNRRSRKSFISK